jgi:RHS repeat-associated protein
MTDFADRIYRYTYDADDNLSAVRYPDDTSDDDSDNPERIYHYEDNRHPHALTGITNEMGNRFATWNYDKQGRAISSEHAGGTERVELAYNSDKTTTVTNTQGQTQTYHFDVIHGVTKVIRIDGGSCDTCDGQFQQTTYDTSGNVASKTDFNGNVTHYTHDLERNLEIRRTKGVGTAEERTIATQWHTDFRLPIAIDVLNNAGNHLKRTAFNYDAVGRLLTRTETDIATGAKRTVTNTYNAAGLLANTDGPRTDLSDITTYEYDAHGNLIKTTNALNHETVITQHDAHGRPLRLIDVNGLVTQLAYNARGRLLSRTMDGQVTRFSYDQVGNLTGITLPNGAALTYTYDGARRLTAIQDNLGNRMNYTLDAVGNRIKEEVFDASDVLSRTHARVFNSLNQLVKDTGGEGQMRQYGYDANGNSISVIDGQNHETRSAFDVLNRLIASTDAENGISEYTYDALDNLVTVKDPKGLLTHYTYNALGDLLQLESPDTGISSYTYDAAGNRISQHDARGIEVLYRYDALNQLTGIDYPDDNTLDVTFIYDQEPNAVGRLSAMHDASGITRYQYDVRGNPITIETTRSGLTHITAYVYDSIDQLTQITYPSGRTVDYVRNALGQVLRVSTTSTAGETQVLAEGITYAPFGSMTGLAFGNGTTLNRTLDLGYRLVANTQPGILEQGFTHDGADNIIAITHDLDLARDQQLGYDPLNRLISANSSYGNTTYDYDELGNRLNKTTNTLLDTYTYDSASHHLQSITGQNRLSFDYSANGNTIAKGNLTFNYGAHNRLKKVSRQGVITAVYTYNGRGERVKKNANTITYFHYDSIGQLLAESDTQGRVIKEYVYLDGLPLALLSTGSEADTSPPAVINTPVNHSWRTVTLPEQNQRPVIIAGPPTFNGSQPGVIRLRAVSSSTVQVAFKEWNYLDGFHVEEQVTLLALAPGRHVQPDGSVWVVGTFELANTHRYQRQHFGEVLPGRPALFLTAQTANGGDTVTVRARNVSATGFDAALFEQESKMTSGHITETVGYLAIYSKNSGGTVRLNDQPVGYTLATTELYHSFKRIGSHTLKIEEERSKDRETLHIKETIALLHIAGHLFAQDVSAKGGDTSALRHRAGVVQPPTQSIMPAGAFFIHTDHLGTPQALTDDRQQIVWQAVYNPFGEATITTQAMAFNLRFPGQYFDAESGLHYNYFRYYDPGTGRYSTSDPIGLDGGLNSYGYVDGNPVNFIDPLGLASSRTTTKPTFPGPFDILFPNTPTNDAFVSSTKSFLNTIFGDAENCDDECDPPEGVKFNKVTHYSKHGRSLDPNNGSHGCMAKTGSPIHWHYDVNDKAPNGKCHTRKHVFGGCGVAPA